MNYFSYPLLLVFGIVLLLVLVVTKKVKQTQTLAQAARPLSLGLAVLLTLIIYTPLYFVWVFYSFNRSAADSYSKNRIEADTYLVIKPTALLESLDTPVYVGNPTPITVSLADTLVVVADYQKGDLMSGENYKQVSYQTKFYWISAGSIQSLFAYTYSHQPTDFSADAEQNAVYWVRAKKYLSIYADYHKGDVSTTIDTDSLMRINWEVGYGGGYLSVARKPASGKFLYTVDAINTQKGREQTVINGVADRFGNKPSNQGAFTYYIMNGRFLTDKVAD
jgi:hypothetical protein